MNPFSIIRKLLGRKDAPKSAPKLTTDQKLAKLFANKKYFGEQLTGHLDNLEKLRNSDYSYIALYSEQKRTPKQRILNKNNKKICSILYDKFKNQNIVYALFNHHTIDIKFTGGFKCTLWCANLPYAFISRVNFYFPKETEFDKLLVMPNLQYYILKKILKFNPNFKFYDSAEEDALQGKIDELYAPIKKDKLLKKIVETYKPITEQK